MCILFLYLNPDPAPGSLKLVLAMNRDEVLSRPTKEATWGEDFLGGRDMEKGREGGTWMGMDRNGRVAMLTNIFTGAPPSPDKRGRGALVKDFLGGTRVAAAEYAEEVAKEGHEYNPFNLCLLEPDEKGVYGGSYVCCGGNWPEGPTRIQSGFFGLSNHPASDPFRKTSAGLETFRKAVARFGSTAEKIRLIEELTLLMSDRTLHYPDPQAEKQAAESGGKDLAVTKAKLEKGSAIFVDLGKYGTRTLTIVLVDHAGNVTFKERNRPKKENEEWSEKTYNFKV